MICPGYKKITEEDDLRFFSMTKGFNQRWRASNCEAIYLCYNAGGTARALDDALKHYRGDDGKGVRIKSGGHCYEDFVFSDDTLAILDVTPMSEVGYDGRRGYYLGSGGTNWTAFQSLFRDFGKVLPSGSCYSVGLGGHISSGGKGILSRLHGLTVDWLTGVEIVVKDKARCPAKAIYVSTESRGDKFDLFWALRGGGSGNFGIITRYYFKKLPDAPKGAIISTISFDWKQLNEGKLKQILDWYVNFASQDDNWHTSGKFQLMHESAGAMKLLLHSAYHNEDEKGEVQEYQNQLHKQLNDIFPYQTGGPSMAGHSGWWSVPPMPMKSNNGQTEKNLSSQVGEDYSFYEAVQIMNSSGPNQRGKYKSAYVCKKFPQEQIDTMFEHLKSKPDGLTPEDMQQSLLQIDTFGGEIRNHESTEMAYAQRKFVVKLQYQTYWVDENNDDPHLEWIQGFYEEMYEDYGGTPDPDQDSDGLLEGCYYGYPDVDLNNHADGVDHALWLYFLDNYRKNDLNLLNVKKRWDPENYFQSQQSIPIKSQ